MVNIRLVTIGQFGHELDVNKIISWESVLFKVIDHQQFDIALVPDLPNWGCSDKNLNSNFPTPENLRNVSTAHKEVPMNVFVVDVPLEYNYYSRILANNCVVVTYYQIREILYKENIPLENFMLRLLYAYSFIYLAKQGTHMSMSDEARFAHARKGCLFDMCGIKAEVADSSVSPKLCSKCEDKLKGKVSTQVIKEVRKELTRIRKDFYYKVLSFLKGHPYYSMTISVLAGILINLISNAIFELVHCILTAK